jgi:hypothetical protein
MAALAPLAFVLACAKPDGPAATFECTEVEYVADEDGDGFGGPTVTGCDPPSVAPSSGGDCDDSNPDVHPEVATDGCNDIDDDCDGSVDEDAPLVTFFRDADDDGWGVPGKTVEACAEPPGYAANVADCDDNDPFVNGGDAEDWTNGVDDNCDGIVEIETPVEVVGANTYQQSWDAPTDVPTKLRVLKMDYDLEEIRVVHDVPESVVLFFLGSDGDHVVEETYPGTIARIFVYEEAEVTAPDSVLVSYHDGRGPFVWGPSSWDSQYTPDIVDEIEAMTELPITSFHFTNSSAEAVIQPADDWMDLSAYPDCSKPTGTEPGGLPDRDAIIAPACATVLDSEHVCVTTSSASIEVIGLEGETSCEVESFGDNAHMSAASIAWSGEHVYACTQDYGMLQRVSLRDGTVEKAYVYCDGVGAFDDGSLYVLVEGLPPNWDVPVYASWADVRCGGPSWYAPHTSNERVAIDGDMLYSSWHSTAEYDWLDLVSAEEGTVSLERADALIYGIDVTSDGWFVVAASGETQWFRATDGERLGSVPFSGTGLACATQ